MDKKTQTGNHSFAHAVGITFDLYVFGLKFDGARINNVSISIFDYGSCSISSVGIGSIRKRLCHQAKMPLFPPR